MAATSFMCVGVGSRKELGKMQGNIKELGGPTVPPVFFCQVGISLFWKIHFSGLLVKMLEL